MTPRIIAANLGVRLRGFIANDGHVLHVRLPVILVLVFGNDLHQARAPQRRPPVQDNSGSEASHRLLEPTGDAFTVKPPIAVDATQYARNMG
jgi:hypothetical protein